MLFCLYLSISFSFDPEPLPSIFFMCVLVPLQVYGVEHGFGDAVSAGNHALAEISKVLPETDAPAISAAHQVMKAMRGLMLIYAGKNEQASAQLSALAAELEGSQADAQFRSIVLTYWAGALDNLKKGSEAVAKYDQALSLDNKNVDAMFGRACSKHTQGNFKEAIEGYSGTLALDAKHTSALNNRGAAHFALSDKQQSSGNDYTQALGINPVLPHTVFNRAVANVTRTLEAAQTFQDATRLHPNFLIAYTNLAAAQQTAGKYREALDALSSAISLSPIDPMLYASRGRTYKLLNMHVEAQEDNDRAVALRQAYTFPAR
eukprot:TRINITY_DN4983_c0_g1_i3.p1 TRINITY_DN4983_c0_g1~~TRINITY_DN4983_c0_g1_i3.p1  ORF type:complete len:319 (-),score=91.38 TRINITY_DN4983_c0_g1_i3:35-991(-)